VGRRQAAAAGGDEWPFRPAITKLGARQKPRSMEDMSEGERLRREAKLVGDGVTSDWVTGKAVTPDAAGMMIPQLRGALCASCWSDKQVQGLVLPY
jgi:hypothetical protein